MTASDSPQVGANEPGLTVERVFDAPPALIWRAWTEPEHFKRWYGPQGVTMPTCEIDFRLGGRHLFGLQMPDGNGYWTTGVYQEISPIERFAYTDAFADAQGNVVPGTHYGMSDDAHTETVVTVILEDIGGGKTKLTLRQAVWADAAMAQGASDGWNQALDKLAAELAGKA
ncbi:MAG: putative conserved protein YndB, AHSA1/START domain [Chloroflexi bacterium]|nr:MAG: putative conserved protein YndB, AHSA1/START domain [Chloroflexota bacterium]